jgi:hypothetical protein
MEIIKHFEVYIDAQKLTGIQFIVFGLLILTISILLHFSQLNPIIQGLKNGFFVLSFLLMLSGIGFYINQTKLFNTKNEVYQFNPEEFKKQEVNRMEQVNKSVPNIILFLGATILLLLIIVLFIYNPLWKGVLFSLLIYLLGLLIIESISYLSVKNYLQSLLNI